MKRLLFAAGTVAMTSGAAFALPVDLNLWTAESYPSVSGFPNGVWTVDGSGATVTQSQNGQPTLFYSDFTAQGSEVTGKVVVNSNNDDDFFGFVLGFDGGDSLDAGADYLLVDWKRNSQFFDFGDGSSPGPGYTALRGLAVSRVTGIPTADEFWGHQTWTGAGAAAGGLQELARGTTLGSSAWVVGQTYEFSFDFGPNNLVVSVDGVQQFNITGTFENGSIGFYNFSQADVTYSAFEKDSGSFPAVPLPASAWLLTAAIGGLALRRRR